MFKKLFGALFSGQDGSGGGPTLEQRRRGARRPCEFEVEASYGKKSFVAKVVDMGMGGVLLRCSTPQDLPKKVTLRLTYPQDIPKYPDLTVQAVVRWTRLRSYDSTQFVGVEFKNPKTLGTSWVKAKTKDIGFESFNLRDQRKSLRLTCKIPATIELEGGWTMRASIRNLGLGGFFVVLLKPIRAGATIVVKVDDELELPRTTYTAVIRHQQHADPSSPYGYGCAFKDLKDSQVQELKAYLLKAQGKQWETLKDSDEDIHQDLMDMTSISTAEPKLQQEAGLQEEMESEDSDSIEGSTRGAQLDEEQSL